MKPITILALQSFLVFLQMANAGIATLEHVPPVVALLVAAFVGAFQFFVNHLGNQTVPPAALKEAAELRAAAEKPRNT